MPTTIVESRTVTSSELMIMLNDKVNRTELCQVANPEDALNEKIIFGTKSSEQDQFVFQLWPEELDFNVLPTPLIISDPENVKCWVSIYNVSREYGGSEEGGWWYDWRTLETVIPTTFDHLDETYTRMQEKYSNKGRRELSSVLSDGCYMVCAEMTPGENASKERPYYS